MSNPTEVAVTLSTTVALDLIAYERAPRHSYASGSVSRINRRIVCADGFKVSVQASSMHYASDSADRSPYWSTADDPDVAYPFLKFEVGNPSGPVPDSWDADDSVWAWVPREDVADMLDAHGGAVAWEVPA